MPHTTWNEILFALNGYYDDVSKGDCYEQGILVDQDLEVAVSFYRKAAEQGNAEGLFRLGRYHFKLAHIADAAKYYALAAARIHEAARSALLALTAAADTNGVADYHLALLFTHEQNWALARNHYQRAIAHHYPDAAYQLGLLYMENRLTPTGGAIIIGQNISEALRYYKIAASEYSFAGLNAIMELIGTSSKASFYLGELYASIEGIPSKNMARAIEYYTLSSEKGDPDAPFRLGEIFELGAEGVAINLQRACGHYLCAAKRRNISALNKLREIARAKVIEAQLSLHDYFLSQGNKLEAIQWAMRASEQKHSGMQRYLDETTFSHTEALQIAQWYESSDIVTPNAERAFGFYQKADTLGNRDASFRLAKTYENGSALINQDYHLSANYFLKAANRGHPEALTHALRLVTLHPTAELCHQVAKHYHQVQGDSLAAIPWYKRSADQSHEASQTALLSLAGSNATYAYTIGKTYQEKSSWKTACQYYHAALSAHHADSIHALKTMGLQPFLTAQMMLHAYYLSQGDRLEAVRWAIRAAAEGHEPAKHFLTTTLFTGEEFDQIGKMYEAGEIVRRQMAIAISYYQKASGAGLARSSFRLAQLFEAGETDCARDLVKSADYYLFAARQQHPSAYPEALSALIPLVEQLNDAKRYHTLGDYYQVTLNDASRAARWYQQALFRGHDISAESLKTLAKANATVAVEIAGRYEARALERAGSAEEGSSQEHAIHFYHFGLERDYQAALSALERIGIQGSVAAQYLVHRYYETKHNTSQAIHWALRAADKAHIQTLRYLDESAFSASDCANIAAYYERGEWITANLDRAIVFYTRAAALNHRDSMIRLGDYYCEETATRAPNIDQACKYYLRAIRQGHRPSLMAIEAIGERASAAIQYEIAELYFRAPFNTLSKAKKWYVHAAEAGHGAAATQLSRLENQAATLSGATLFRRVTLTIGHTEANLLSDGRGNFKAGLDGRQIDDTDSLSHCLHQLER